MQQNVSKACAVICMLFWGHCTYGQTDTIRIIALDTVRVEAARLLVVKKELPAAVSVKRFGQIQQNQQQLTINEYLQGIPGLFVQNTNNFAQDARISIRGFGSRSAFGIRGIKLLVDGIPETTPDGQGQVDNLNLGLLETIEILRGTSSSLYGNASGGVINIQTLSSFTSDFIEISTAYGSYGFETQQLIAGLKDKKATTTLFANRTFSNGYRLHSTFETYQFNLRTKLQLGQAAHLNLQLNYTDSPMAEDPGGITAETVADDRTQARDRNIEFNAGEEVKQLKTGAALQWNPNNIVLNTFAYYSYRDFANRLPFLNGGAVDLTRNYWGHGTNLSISLTQNKKLVKAQLGYEVASQNDRRTRFVNDFGTLGDPTLRQNEIFETFGTFGIVQYNPKKWSFRGGLRFDHNVLRVDDAFLQDGDASDRRLLNTLNPSLGIKLRWDSAHSSFANYSTSFETPVLSELSADPENNGGFNQALGEQTATTYEAGHSFTASKVLLEGTLFYVETKGDIVPYELEAFPDRVFYRNAGSTERLGIEWNSTIFFGDRFRFNASYAWSKFRYKAFEVPAGNFSGNQLPGVPQHLASIQGRYQSKKGLVLQINAQHRGSFFADDANTATEKDAQIINLSASQKCSLGELMVKPYLGINNLLNIAYSDNIRINASGNRYFEPAPKINAYGGIRISL